METPQATINIRTGRAVHPTLLQAAKTDSILSHMIAHGMPLTRQTWIDLNWGSEVPNPWTAEDEAQLPPPFRRQL